MGQDPATEIRLNQPPDFSSDFSTGCCTHGAVVTPFLLRAVKDWEHFCLCRLLIKTVMRLFTAAIIHSCGYVSIDYDSHE